MTFLLCSLDYFLSLAFIILLLCAFRTRLKEFLLRELKPELKVSTVIQIIQTHYFVGI